MTSSGQAEHKDVSLASRSFWSLASTLVILNILIATVVSMLKLPLYLDSVGIVAAAVLLGLRGAIAVAILTALLGTFTVNPYLWAYTGTAVCIALVASLLAHWGLFKRVFLVPIAGLIIGAVAATASAPVTAYLFGGVTASGTDFLTALFSKTTESLLQAVFWAGLSSDPVDKLLVALIAYAGCRSLPRSVLRHFPKGLQRLGIEQ